LAGGAAGGHLEQPAGREAGEELQERQSRRQPHLGVHPRPWGCPQTRGKAREAEGRQEGQGWRTGRQGRAREGQGDQHKTTAAKNAPKAKKAARTEESAGPREGSKTAKVVAMLQRKNGATLEEIMTQMGWQRHTVRGMIAGSLKKAGYTVESFKSEKGDRTYRINA